MPFMQLNAPFRFWLCLVALNLAVLGAGAYGIRHITQANQTAAAVPQALADTFTKAMPLVVAHTKAAGVPEALLAPTQQVLQAAYVTTLSEAVAALQTPSIYGTATHSALDYHVMLAALRTAQNTPLAIDAQGAMTFLQNVHNASETWAAQATVLTVAMWWRSVPFMAAMLGLVALVGNALALQRRPQPYRNLTQAAAAHARGEVGLDAVIQHAALLPTDLDERQALMGLLKGQSSETSARATAPRLPAVPSSHATAPRDTEQLAAA